MPADYTTNQYGDITGTVAATLEKQALKHAQPHLVLSTGAKKMSLPKNDTKVLRCRRPIPFVAATTALTEGIVPNATELRYDQIDIPILQYGAYVTVTDQLVDLHTTPVLGDINKLNAEQAAKTKEALLWGQLRATTNVQYANGVAGVSSVTQPLTLDEQRKAVRTLHRNKAMKFTSIVQGGVKENTFPIEAAFICFAHTDAEAAIRAMDGFVPVARYGSMKPIHAMELGSVDNVRYILSADLYPQLAAGGALGANIGSGSTDVYTSIFVGTEAYACMNLAGKGVYTPVVRSVGNPTDSDPLGQTGSVGWKMYSGELVLNTDWIVAVKHSVVA
ncbi:MAG: N4-gp56 family major capsid protein [Parvularculaceae bacterium]|nr:N4-gp56 family major capsid protein [Epibacterium sp.]NQX74753.1 N4-gp56 family major capsid protein [Epibacterium sp.]NRA31091.1 N4-gp56 family major capsid protein [Parvularculaceae bacterium]